MYEINEATTHLEESVGGRTYRFRLLTVYDRLGLIAKIKKSKRDELIGDIDACALDKEQKFAQLAAFNDAWNEADEFIKFVNCSGADTELSAMTIDVEGDAAPIIAKLRPKFGWLAFKAALCNLELRSADVPPNPPIPPANNPTPGEGKAYGT